MKNIIIGGGISGLLIAYKLSKRGEEVIVLEKNKDLGGLLGTDWICQTKIEKFYHHIFKSDNKAIGLINELGLANDLAWFDSSMSIYYENKFYPFRKPIDLINFNPIGLIDRLRTGLITFYLQKNTNWQKFESVPAYIWMQKYGGLNAYKVIWKPLLVSKFGKYFKKVSMVWLWGRIYLRAKSTEKNDEKLGYIKGSFGKIIDKLEQKIKDNSGLIKTGVEIKKIEKTNKETVVDLGGEKIKADRVIVCTSGDQMAKMIGHKNMYNSLYKKLNRIKYIGAINLIFSSQQNLVDYYWNNVNDLDSPFVALVKHSQLVGKYNNRHVYYLGAYVDEKEELFLKSDKEVQELFFGYLKKMCPVFDLKKVEEIKVFRSSRAQQITDTDYRRKIVGIKTEIEGVYFLNFSQIYPWDRGLNWAIDKCDELVDIL